ncbi:MAG: hypothetical protein KKA60_10830 [Proteobacteria bacterium]|nr:hypothetical protein [Pseudomonadota bacterium]
MKRNLFGLLTVLCLVWAQPGPARAWTFDIADMAGTWESMALVVGDRWAQEPRIEYGTVAMDALGNATKSYTWMNNLGGAQLDDSWDMVMDSQGIVTRSNPAEYTFNYAVSQDMSLMAGVDSDDGHRLELLMRRDPGTVFNYEDLLGTWYYHAVASGDGDMAVGEKPRWVHGTVEIVSHAAAAAYTATLDGFECIDPKAVPETRIDEWPYLKMDKKGVVTWPGSFLRWVLSDDKKMMMGVRLSAGNLFEIMVRRDVSVRFGVSDTAGDWLSQAVVSGDNSGGAGLYWDVGIVSIGTNGTGSAQWLTSEWEERTVDFVSMMGIDANGQLLIENDPSFFFTMTDDKQVIVGCKNGANFESQLGGFRMEIMFKRDFVPDAPFVPRSGSGTAGPCFISGLLKGR